MDRNSTVGVIASDTSTGLPRERRSIVLRDVAFLALAIVIILVVTELPYLYGYWSSPSDKQFMGILLDVPDTAQYLSWARESTHALLIENKLTPEHGAPVFFNLFWLAVGRLSLVLGTNVTQAMLIVRPLAGAFYLAALYWLITVVTRNRWERWVSFFVVGLGGGLGWILVVVKQVSGKLPFPLDLYVVEPNTFLSVLAVPHQAMADGLLVVILGVATLAFERNSVRLAAVAGCLGLALGLQHGYDLLIVYAVVGIMTLTLICWRRRDWLRLGTLCLIVGVISAPAAIYLLALTRLSPIWQGVLAQYGNAGVFTPSPAHLLVLMGLPLILLVGIRPAATPTRITSERDLLLATWLVIGCVLLYIPTDFQVKMLGGWQIPVGILAIRAFRHLVAPMARRGVFGRIPVPGIVLGIILVATVLPTNIYLFAWRFTDLARHNSPYYLSVDDLAAMRWLETNAKPSDVVLSSLAIGQYIPSVSGNQAFLAHWAETLNFYDKSRLVAQFYSGAESDAARNQLLRSYDVRYVFYSEEEKTLGTLDPSNSPGLVQVFSRPHASIYQVRASVVDSGPNSVVSTDVSH